MGYTLDHFLIYLSLNEQRMYTCIRTRPPQCVFSVRNNAVASGRELVSCFISENDSFLSI